MNITETSIRKFIIIMLLFGLGIFAFFVLKQVFLATVGGLLLAYTFMPVYNFILKIVKERNIAAAIVSFIVVCITIIPLWFILPVIMNQAFQTFQFLQAMDIGSVIKKVFPAASEQMTVQITISVSNTISKLGATTISKITDYLLNLPRFFLNMLIMAFVFFFAMRDSDKLKEFSLSISPFPKAKEIIIVKQFKDMTNSIIYGQVIVGLVQGTLAGIGLLMFAVPNAILFTFIAIVFSIIPLIGPGVVWVPATLFLYSTSSLKVATAYLLYNLLVVSIIDNVLRSYIVARKNNISTAIVFVGMIGGLLTFGLLGLIIGPLILAYILTFLRAYGDKTLSGLFE